MEVLMPGEIMNVKRYLELLNSRLELFMARNGTTPFLEDGVPCHKAKIITDLNPIENV
jgi:hypothetical protein